MRIGKKFRAERLIRRVASGAMGAFVLLFLIGCFRGQPKKQPPVHVVPDMDFQKKLDPQESSTFFRDGKAMRSPVYGTVPRGELNTNDSLYLGKTPEGEFLQENPLVENMEVLNRGQQEYNIYCSPCHSRVGDGRGIMLEYGYPPPASFHDERLVEQSDGYIFDVITNGKRNMPGYASQIPVRDRWAIVAYVRALQRSQNASLSDVPEEMRDNLK